MLKSNKSIVLEHFQKNKLELPNYNTTNIGTNFQSTMMFTKDNTIIEIQGNIALNKKQAEHNVSEKFIEMFIEKKEISKNEFKTIKNKISEFMKENNKTIFQLPRKYEEKIMNTLSNHICYDFYVKQGINGFYIINENEKYYYAFLDNNENLIKFSFSKCCSTKKIIKQFFRDSIKKQINDFKESKRIYDNDFIDYFGNIIDNDQVTIDHVTKFKNLLNNFLEDEQINIDEIEIIKNDKGEISIDKTLLNKFQNYHFKNAKLRLLSKEDHQLENIVSN